jgi:hypothetical protein
LDGKLVGVTWVCLSGCSCWLLSWCLCDVRCLCYYILYYTLTLPLVLLFLLPFYHLSSILLFPSSSSVLPNIPSIPSVLLICLIYFHPSSYSSNIHSIPVATYIHLFIYYTILFLLEICMVLPHLNLTINTFRNLRIHTYRIISLISLQHHSLIVLLVFLLSNLKIYNYSSELSYQILNNRPISDPERVKQEILYSRGFIF